MIDTSKETPISLAQAAALLPRRRAGRKAHPSTLFRWAASGVRGIRLEVIQVGGTKCTSAEALQRFYERLSAQAGIDPQPAPPVRTLAQQRRANERAAKELKAAGI